MKKFYFAVALCLSAVMLLTACNSDKNNEETTSQESTSYSSGTDAAWNNGENPVPGEAFQGNTEITTAGSETATAPGETSSQENTSGETVTTAPASSSQNPSQSGSQGSAPASSGGSVSADNEYEILRSGSFYIKGSMTEGSGVKSPLEMAVTPESVYMLTEFSEGVDVGMLVNNDKIYMIYPEGRAYVEISDSIMKMVGFDLDEAMGSGDVDFSSFGSLSEATSVVDEVYNGVNCKVYTVKDGTKGTARVYMNGNELLRFAAYSTDGSFLSSTEVDEISSNVPSDKRTPPSGYNAYNGFTGMMKFMGLLTDVM